MLSVVIATHDNERALLATLAVLVPGAAVGLVREVIVAHAGSDDAITQIADVAGCRLMTSQAPRGARLKLAADAARSAWLLFLQPGLMPDVSWIEETRRFIEQAEISGRAGASAAVFRPSSGVSITMEAIGLLRRALGARPDQGLLIAKRLYAELAGHDARAKNPERDLVRRLGRRRVALLQCATSLVGRE